MQAATDMYRQIWSTFGPKLSTRIGHQLRLALDQFFTLTVRLREDGSGIAFFKEKLRTHESDQNSFWVVREEGRTDGSILSPPPTLHRTQ
jgi:hypothetical protein